MIGRAAQKTSGAPNCATEEYRNHGGAKQKLLSLGVNDRSHFPGSIGAKAAENVSAAFAVLCFVPCQVIACAPKLNRAHRSCRTYGPYSEFFQGQLFLRCPR